MRVGWIYPFRKRCGIRYYSEDYINALKNKIDIVSLNPQLFLSSPELFKKEIKKCDIIHIQYETSIFRNNSKDFFLPLVKYIKAPIVITLHEVYEKDPFVYPREEIKGFFLLSLLRKIIWDIKHPLQCSFNLHLSKKFRASRILVHHYYQKDILIKKRISEDLIEVFPIYIKKIPFNNSRLEWQTFKQSIEIGAHGFINPTYNYELLFSVLSQIKIPWNFTWIGGLRLSEHRYLLEDIISKVNQNGWQERFKITGWLKEEEVIRKLLEIDIFIAIFKIRSTSSIISKLLGCCKPVIATEIPLVKEMAGILSEDFEIPPIIVTKQQPEDIVNKIYKLIEDSDFLMQLKKSINKFTEVYSLEKMSERLIEIYKGILKR